MLVQHGLRGIEGDLHTTPRLQGRVNVTEVRVLRGASLGDRLVESCARTCRLHIVYFLGRVLPCWHYPLFHISS